MAAPSRLETLQTLRATFYDVAFATAFGTLFSGAFMIGFIRACHGGDFWIGFIAAIGSLIGILQIPGAIWGRGFPNYKSFIWPGGFTWRLLYIPIAFLPILALNGNTKLVIAAVLIVVASATVQIVNPIYTDWLAELVPPKSRGAFFTKRNAISTGVGSALGIIGGVILDHFRLVGQENLGLSIIFGLGVTCGFISFFYFSKMKDQPRAQPIKQNVWEGVKSVSHPFRDKKYLPILIYLGFGVFSRTFPQPFFAAYALETLKLPFTVITICGAMQSLSIILFSPLIGFFTDKYGNKPILVIGGVFVAMNPFLWAFARDNALLYDTVYLLGCHLFFGIAWTIIGPSQGNLMMNTAPVADRANYIASANSVMTLVAGISPLVGSVLMVSLRHFYSTGESYRMMFIGSGIMRFLAIFLLLFVHEEGAFGLKETLTQIVQASPRSMRAARQLDQPATPKEREAMIAVLTKQPSAMAVEGLVRALDDPLPRVRRSAADALSKLDHSQVQTELILKVIDHIKNHPELVEEETLDVIGGFGSFEDVKLVMDPLVDLLQSPRGPIKRAAAHALGRLGLQEAIPFLCEAVHTGDRDTRRAALQALRVLQAKEAYQTIVHALEDPNASVSTAAAEAVAELYLDQAAPALRRLLAESDQGQSRGNLEANPAEVPQRPWDALAYALACVGEQEDLGITLSAAHRLRTQQSQRTVLLAAARLLGCEPQVYKALLTRGFDRESILMDLLRPFFKRHPGCMAVLNEYSERSQNYSDGEADANGILRLIEEIDLKSDEALGAIMNSRIRESFVVACAYLASRS